MIIDWFEFTLPARPLLRPWCWTFGHRPDTWEGTPMALHTAAGTEYHPTHFLFCGRCRHGA